MAKYLPDKASSKLHVWTYKEGLLSKVAHDLQLLATDWEGPVDLDGDRFTVELTVAVAGLKCQGKVDGGSVIPMKDKDHRDIDDEIVGKKIFNAKKHPRIRYSGSGTRGSGEVQVDGQLTLTDSPRPLPVRTRIEEEGSGFKVEGEIRFNQSQFGIKPFSAMLGTLKVKDELRVSWQLYYQPA